MTRPRIFHLPDVEIPPSSRRTRNWTRGWTLAETMVSLAIFAISSGVLYDCFRASLFLQDKNFALNEANTNLQWSHYNLLSNLESAAFFVDCANYDPNAQTFTAVPPGTWGNAVRFMRLLPVTCYVLPADGSGYTINNPPPATRNVSLSSSTQNVYLSYNPSLYSPSVIPMSARFYPAFPAVSGTVSGGSSPGAKPGLNFDNIDTSVADVIGLHFPTPLGAGAFQDCNRAYFIVESAFAVTQDPNDGHKQLLYFADTSQTAMGAIRRSRTIPLFRSGEPQAHFASSRAPIRYRRCSRSGPRSTSMS
jgi:hypothetical protein